jgi:hypothetical protein
MTTSVSVHNVLKDIEIKRSIHEDDDGNFEFAVITIIAESKCYRGEESMTHEIKFFVRDKDKYIRLLT